MPYSPRKDEVEAVMSAIESEESLEAVARTALRTACSLMQRRDLWVLAQADSHTLLGPYASDTDVYNALAAGRVDGFVDEEGIKAVRKEGKTPNLGGRAAVMQLRGPLAAGERYDAIDLKAYLTSNRLCVTCEHSLVGHGVTNRSSGCSVYGCTCPSPKRP